MTLRWNFAAPFTYSYFLPANTRIPLLLLVYDGGLRDLHVRLRRQIRGQVRRRRRVRLPHLLPDPGRDVLPAAVRRRGAEVRRHCRQVRTSFWREMFLTCNPNFLIVVSLKTWQSVRVEVVSSAVDSWIPAKLGMTRVQPGANQIKKINETPKNKRQIYC